MKISNILSSVVLIVEFYSLFLRLPSPVPGMVGQGQFNTQSAMPSVPGVKPNQPSIATVTTATQPMMPQQQVAPNQQQPVPPPGQAVSNQQAQAQPQQQPTANQPTVASAQPNMVSRTSSESQESVPRAGGGNCCLPSVCLNMRQRDFKLPER